METTLRERLGKCAYMKFYGKYGNWDTTQEDVREAWRDAAEVVVKDLVATFAPGMQSLVGAFGNLASYLMDESELAAFIATTPDEPGLRIPPGLSVSSALRPKM